MKKGVYKTHTFDVDDEAIKCLIVLTVIAINSKAYYEITELFKYLMMFPFNYSITHELLYLDLFLLNNFVVEL